MDLQQHGGLITDGLLVVLEVRLVGGAHFPEEGAAGRHDLRQAEGAADLHLPGDDDLFSLGQGGKGQEHRGRVIVDHQGRLGTGELLKQHFQVVLAGAALAQIQVISRVL